jgi:hypothetical protein
MTAPMIATLWLARSPPATAYAVSLAGQQRQGLRLRANERGIEYRFGKSPLLPSEHAQVHAAIFAEGPCFVQCGLACRR